MLMRMRIQHQNFPKSEYRLSYTMGLEGAACTCAHRDVLSEVPQLRSGHCNDPTAAVAARGRP